MEDVTDIGLLKALFQEKTQDEWVKFFVHHEACCEPVLDLDAAAAHPLAREQDFWIEVPAWRALLRGSPAFRCFFLVSRERCACRHRGWVSIPGKF